MAVEEADAAAMPSIYQLIYQGVVVGHVRKPGRPQIALAGWMDGCCAVCVIGGVYVPNLVYSAVDFMLPVGSFAHLSIEG